MVEAYYFREQKSWLPFRRLSSIIINIIKGEDDITIKDSDIEWLSMIDHLPPPPQKKVPIIWDADTLQNFYKEYNITPEK